MGLSYPPARTVADVETVGGGVVADPYRWLEEDSAESRAWCARQSELAAGYVQAWEGFPDVVASVREHRAPRVPDLPQQGGDAWFWPAVADGVCRVLCAPQPYGEARVVAQFPPRGSDEQAPFVPWFAVSPDGATLAVGVCRDGSEHNVIELYDTGSGARLDDSITKVLHDGWVGGIVWLPDSSGFFYLALVGPAADFRQEVFFHRLGTVEATASEEIPYPPGFQEYTLVQVSPDGRWAVALCDRRTPLPLARCDLTGERRRWEPFVANVAGAVYGHIVDDRYVAVTTVGAPRGRIVSISLDSGSPDDPSTWRELVPESEAVLHDVVPVADVLYVAELRDTYAGLRVVDRDGAELLDVPLPGLGALGQEPFPLMESVRRATKESFLFSFATLTSSWGVYRHTPGQPVVDVLKEPEIVLRGATVSDRWATSKDGTRVPYHVVLPPGARDTEPRPALVYGYGGFNATCLPVYQTALGVFVDAGGAFVHVHLRGGGEFGSEWWHGGRRETKQNCYDDLYAVAEQLIATNLTRSSQLAVTGASNGGLMCGVAVAQRPELWAAVVPRVPLMDLVGAFRSRYTAVSSREFGTPDDEAGLAHLLSISPYHLVQSGVAYPPVYVDAGASDPRCPPGQIAKWTARMQAAQAGPAPIVLHLWENAGHGWATPERIEISEYAEWLSFVMMQVGLTP